jgi:ferredoxin
VRVVIDSGGCTGHGRCYALAPEVFDADDQGHGVVKVADTPESLSEEATLAIVNCPERVISVIE